MGRVNVARAGRSTNASAVCDVLCEMSATGRLTTNNAEPITVATKLSGRTTMASAATASKDRSSKAWVRGVPAARKEIQRERRIRRRLIVEESSRFQPALASVLLGVIHPLDASKSPCSGGMGIEMCRKHGLVRRPDWSSLRGIRSAQAHATNICLPALVSAKESRFVLGSGVFRPVSVGRAMMWSPWKDQNLRNVCNSSFGRATVWSQHTWQPSTCGRRLRARRCGKEWSKFSNFGIIRPRNVVTPGRTDMKNLQWCWRL